MLDSNLISPAKDVLATIGYKGCMLRIAHALHTWQIQIDNVGAAIHPLQHWYAASTERCHQWHWLWLQLSAESDPHLQEGLPLPSGSTRSPSPKSRWQSVCHRYSSLSSSRQLPETQDAAPH